MQEQLLALLPANNGWMSFDAFKQAAQAAGLRVELWRRLKMSGAIEARISESGVHELRVNPNGS